MKLIKFNHPKDYKYSSKIGFYFVSSLLIFLFIPKYTKGYLYVPVAIQEIGETTYSSGFHFAYKNIIKIILFGIIHGLICYIPTNKYINQLLISEEQNKEKKYSSKKKKTILSLLNYSLVFFLFIMVSGHFLHWFFDTSNSFYRIEFGGYENTEIFLLTYFTDEFLAHGMIHISYFFILTIFVCLDLLDKKHESLKWEEFFFIIFIGVGIGIINGEAALEGESALPLYILSIFGIIFLLIWKIKAKLSIKRYPMFLSMLLGNIIVTIYISFHISMKGFIPIYPYIT